ncbi:MAG: IclR family transcriptional regulator [Novosphingobium sp. 28-62-57]|uniref:IclR family transcriptional regulator n=1 Tax=unclassified Novosphingobium TaxID=2644732 RepID=UPI000BD7B6AC|nr:MULTISPECIES: IclR family transcriptional regulator [unclassified Novosphingobium]OYW47962.1 MAG: IclR family transcriptional regulator [Novosphingobium sp. 12-63-9]OYZ10856.1 MAG: IclR family transcriptional regulator [Novosphingobium sp. 28-62-57]OZA34135.1 MAG: IclR family transcriptional regulator [Novosphingobium sp. 17-62-9]HQS69088.1 IclR family transcriptional regulator [Novosphingobium sp.]
MRKGVPTIASFGRILAMLEAVIADGGQSSIAAIARSIAMPVATAHRQVATLVAEGYLIVGPRGQHLAGPRLFGLLHRLDEKQIIVGCAAPLLHHLAADLGTVVQLGTFDSDMVTYRIKTGEGASALFTRVGMQLEAYCSGIGKVLLAHLPEAQLRAYLDTGPFPALTARTITDPEALVAELRLVLQQGFAVDDGEIAEGLYCLAAPVTAPDGRVLAAISVSQMADGMRPAEQVLPVLQQTARKIEMAAFGTSNLPK